MKKEDKIIELIKDVLRKQHEALSFMEIKEQIGIDINDKTLLRRLNKLVKDEVVIKTGKTKGSLYTLTLNAEEGDQPYEKELIPLSNESREILTLINKPEIKRIPIGYNRDFLELYKPNVTSYLSKTDQKKLFEIGKTARQNEPAGTYAKDILQRLLIDLSWNSSRLEGNSYSLLDTQRLISLGEIADNKSAKDSQMILNHKDAIEFIVVNSEDIGFNRYTILNIHGLLSNNLIPDPAASGRIRTIAVGIQKSIYTPLGIPQVIEEMFEMILKKVNQIKDPFEQSFFMMVHLPYLQPFEDVNKRVSRLAANISLNKRNLVPISFVDVPDSLYIKGILAVYELNRIELLKDVFLWAYERSTARYSALRQSLGEPDVFRLKYREKMRALIFEIVSKGLNYKKTIHLIDVKADEIIKSDRKKFKEAIETELMSLHSGNIARYNIRLSEFVNWKIVWKH
ncbi:MAG: Fic family protein [Chitinophagales bacterium]